MTFQDGTLYDDAKLWKSSRNSSLTQFTMNKSFKTAVMFLFGLLGLEVKRRHGFEEHRLKDSLDDDFNWQTYNEEYRQQLLDGVKRYTSKLSSGDYLLVNNVLTKRSDILPLPPHRLLYETIMLLKPSKVMEVGCGGGDHLYNLGILAPEIETLGLDRAEAQLAFARERSGDVAGNIQQFDITMPFSNKLPSVDIAYTIAVLMHIQTGNGHLVALANMFGLASKQVVLMENWTRHPFLDDIKHLFSQGMIPWHEIHFYQRRLPEYQHRTLMVVSASPLSFEPLADYSQLLSPSAELGWV